MATLHEESYGTDRWDRVLAFCLGYISENPQLFEVKDRVNGFDQLAKQVNQTFHWEEPFTPSDLKKKIQYTWKKCGYDGDKSSDDLFAYGVQWRTLPRLESGTNVSFDDVRQAINVSRGQRFKQTEELRYPKRGGAPSKDWTIKCMCPFDKEDGHGSVQCGSCKTWQHVFCYYLLGLVGEHICNDCFKQTAQEQPLKSELATHDTSQDLTELKSLSLTSKDTSGVKSNSDKSAIDARFVSTLKARLVAQNKTIENLKQSLRTQQSLSVFTNIDSDLDALRYVGVPDNLDIIRHMTDIEATLRSLLVSVSIRDFCLDSSILKKQKSGTKTLAFVFESYLPQQALIEPDSLPKNSTKSYTVLDSLLAFLVWLMIIEWVIEERVFSNTVGSDPIGAAMAQVLRMTDGDRVLQRLEFAACGVLLNNKSGWFAQTVDSLADHFAQRSFDMISNLASSLALKAGHQSQSSSVVGDNAKIYLKRIFAIILTLKGKLSMRRSTFRISLPWPGDSFDPKTMHDHGLPDGEQTLKNNKSRPSIDLALCPAVCCLDETPETQEIQPSNGVTVAIFDGSIVRQSEQQEGWRNITKARVHVHRRGRALR